MIVARLLGYLCGFLWLLVPRLTWPRVLGLTFGLAVAGIPSNDCPKHKSGFRRTFRITQPNRDHRRAKARGTLAIVRPD